MQVRIVDIKRVPNGSITEPVTLTMAKTHMRVDFSDDDAYITSLIPQCRRAVENYCFVAVVPTTVMLTVCYHSKAVSYPRGPGAGTTAYNSALNSRPFELPYGPVVTVTAVSYLDDQNVNNALSADNFDYYVRGAEFKTLLVMQPPIFETVIAYNSGYSPVPDDLILAILNEIAFRYEARGDSTNRYATQNVGLSEASQYLANPYKRLSWT